MSVSTVSLPSFDLLFGGPLVLVEKASGKEPSLCILVRGGPGVGKSILATRIATELAEATESEVAYACVELLPTELRAQHETLYDVSTSWEVVPPDAWDERGLRRIFASALDLGVLRDDHVGTRDAVVEQLPAFVDAVRASSHEALRVLVVDSVSADYGLGGRSVPRSFPDTLAKFAAAEGLILVVVEEAYELEVSPWSFAADLVVEIEAAATSRGHRRLRVAKHRFGPAQSSHGELAIELKAGPLVRPPAAAYAVAATTIRTIAVRSRAGEWRPDLAPHLPNRHDTPLIVVESALAPHRTAELGRMLALGTAGPIVELRFDVATRRPSENDMQTISVPLGAFDVSAELVLAALMAGIRSAKESAGIAGIHLLALPSFSTDVLELGRTVEAIVLVARALGVPVVWSFEANVGSTPSARALRSIADVFLRCTMLQRVDYSGILIDGESRTTTFRVETASLIS